MESRLAEVTGVLVETSKDERILAYIVSVKGEAAICEAVAQLAGRRRPYVSNIVKILGVDVPEAVVITPREEGLTHLEEIKKILQNNSARHS
ncbi:hypothetical protein B0G71_0681 [Paraburkholderia sp. BL27I4N3]|uniref:hypothetical protein n=1 Tax=Paraburkholderia sp. BL27I4N3 TaxID=1938805 RepID=UPI000E220A84|nr:hypothetical protein [Paraburkholderia sp. BL27I4N3]REE17720.1 hypothetical protein B0G71_0681 [Paraburkholderia sp. BL27I4N3]